MEKLKVLGTSVEISDALVEYNKVRKFFMSMAEAASDSFRERYADYGDYEMFFGNFDYDLHQRLKAVVSECVSTLVNCVGILEIDEKRFVQDNKYIMEPLGNAVEQINNEFLEIDDTLHQNEAARAIRKESRGRFVGGGFGAGAAVEASVKAGALNMATGAAHGIFNSIGNGIDRMKASSRKKEIYKSPNTLNALCKGLYDSVFRCHIAMINYYALLNIDKRPYDGVIREAAQKSAQAILNNADKIKDDNMFRTALIDALIKDPYQEKWYRVALDRFSDADGSLEAVADYFGCKRGLLRYKEHLIIEFTKNHLLNMDTEESALASRDTLAKLKAALHYSGKIAAEDEIDTKVKFFDEQARTVDGILFETRDEAQVAREELSLIQDRLKSLDNDDVDGMLAARAFLSTLKSKKMVDKYSKTLTDKIFSLFAKRHPLNTEENTLRAKNDLANLKTQLHYSGKIAIEDEIEAKIKFFDEEARTADRMLFETRNEAQVARKELALVQSRLKKLDDNNIDDMLIERAFLATLKSKKLADKYSKILTDKMFSVFAEKHSLATEDEALRAREELKIFKEKIDSHEITAIERKIESEIAKFDKKARTVDEITFDTRDEAEAARREYDLIKKKMASIDEKNLDSLKEARDFIKTLKNQKLVNKYDKKLTKKIKELNYKLEHPYEGIKEFIGGVVSLCVIAAIVYFFFL